MLTVDCQSGCKGGVLQNLLSSSAIKFALIADKYCWKSVMRSGQQPPVISSTTSMLSPSPSSCCATNRKHRSPAVQTLQNSITYKLRCVEWLDALPIHHESHVSFFKAVFFAISFKHLCKRSDPFHFDRHRVPLLQIRKAMVTASLGF